MREGWIAFRRHGSVEGRDLHIRDSAMADRFIRKPMDIGRKSFVHVLRHGESKRENLRDD